MKKVIKIIILAALVYVNLFFYGNIFAEVTCPKCANYPKVNEILRTYEDGSMFLKDSKTGRLVYIYEAIDEKGIVHYKFIFFPKIPKNFIKDPKAPNDPNAPKFEV